MTWRSFAIGFSAMRIFRLSSSDAGAIIPVVLCVLAASTPSHAVPLKQSSPGPTLECLIRADDVGQAFRLQAIARSPQAASGHYRLVVLKQNQGGTSQSAQSGQFTLDPGQDSILTTIMMEQAARGHYEARLSLETDIGSVSCQSP